MSVGALGDPFFLSELLDIASKNGSHIYVPTGAIAGIDAIRSVKHLLDSVVLTTTKNPIALAGAPFFNLTKINLYGITEKTVIYEGNAADAVKKFPANINVAAILSLAGIGIERTKVKIIADPYTDVNQHEITANGKFGEMTVIVRNKPSPNNPKTSFLAVLSAEGGLMKKSQFTESQILAVLKEGEAGVPVAQIMRKHGISQATYYNWKSKYGGASVAELKRLKELEAENAKLKRMYADLALENAAIREVLTRKL